MSELHIGLKLRKEMLQKLKNQVRLYLGEEPASLRRYAAPYKKNIERSRWNLCTSDQLVQILSTSDIVFGGDFHAFAQSQRAHLRLLRQLSKTHKIIFAVECVPSRHQKHLDQYMAGKMAEQQFLKKISWDKQWGFPWSQYKPLFDWIKERGGRCVALNKIQSSKSYRSLIERDVHAAQILSKELKTKKGEELIYVLFGDLHVSSRHLPLQVKKRHRGVKVSQVYLNPEKLYFQLYKKNQIHGSAVVQFTKNEFCLIESPPWVKWQSYLMYLNQNYDQFIDDDGAIDYTEHVHALTQMMCADLGFKIKSSFSVRSFDDLDFMELIKEQSPASVFERVSLSVQNDLNFYMPEKRLAFLARGTVNYSAHLAGLIVHSIVSRCRGLAHPSEKSFEVLIWQETVAFFLSKLINPNRKPTSMDDIKKQLAAFSPQDRGEDSLKLALDQKMHDLISVYSAVPNAPRHRFAQQQAVTYLRAAKLLGAMMGDKLFTGYRTGLLSQKHLHELITYNTDQDDFHHFYIQILKTVDRIDMEPQ